MMISSVLSSLPPQNLPLKTTTHTPLSLRRQKAALRIPSSLSQIQFNSKHGSSCYGAGIGHRIGFSGAKPGFRLRAAAAAAADGEGERKRSEEEEKILEELRGEGTAPDRFKLSPEDIPSSPPLRWPWFVGIYLSLSLGMFFSLRLNLN